MIEGRGIDVAARTDRTLLTAGTDAMLERLLFTVGCRLRGASRVSLRAYVKAPGAIRVGAKTKVHLGATLDASGGGGIVLGDGVTINRFGFIQGSRGGVTIGDGSEINNYSIVNGAGGVRIGRNVLVGPHVAIVSYEHRFADPDVDIKFQGYDYAPIDIGDNVWIGAGAVVLAGVSIGAGTVVAAGSVVTESFGENLLLAGVPARVIRVRTAPLGRA
jgi:acetyltransferase-like isoleucine patch superfamily enzyme